MSDGVSGEDVAAHVLASTHAGLGCWMRATLCSGEVCEWDDRQLQINIQGSPSFLGQVQLFLCLGYRGG